MLEANMNRITAGDIPIVDVIQHSCPLMRGSTLAQLDIMCKFFTRPR